MSSSMFYNDGISIISCEQSQINITPDSIACRLLTVTLKAVLLNGDFCFLPWLGVPRKENSSMEGQTLAFGLGNPANVFQSR